MLDNIRISTIWKQPQLPIFTQCDLILSLNLYSSLWPIPRSVIKTDTVSRYRFRMQSAMLIHARCHLPAELKNRHQCDQCPKRFGTRPNLMAHKRIHTGVRDYTCDQCGKSFVQKGNLDNHLLTHTVARPYTCPTCGKAFKTPVRLRKHGSVHSGLKPYQCDVCGRQFRERGTLKEHHR